MSDMTACLNDLSYIPPNNEQNEPTQGDIGETSNEPTQAIRDEFEELYMSANKEMYPCCDYVTRLDFMAKFTHFKVKGELTDSIFNEMLEFFQFVFPSSKGYKLPPSYYAIKKTFKMIGLGYESIHTCVNDCFLFWAEDNKDKQFCPVCNTSRWKDNHTTGKKVPKKVLRYFLIIPILQCLYKFSHTAKEMTWHATGKCTNPGVKTIDVATGQKFNMRTMVLWTINDFLARSSLSGLSGQAILSRSRCKIIELCSFFKQICSQILMEADILKAQSKVVDILCNLELIYPPAFFDIMIHLVIHLPLEALEGGPIRPRWMYPFKRSSSNVSVLGVQITIPEIGHVPGKFKSEFLDNDMKEAFPGWFGNADPSTLHKQRPSEWCELEEILEFLYMSLKVMLFRAKWFDTSNEGCKIKRFVIRNNITQILAHGEAFKNDQYILATQVKQCFYLKDMARRPPGWKVVQDVNHKKYLTGGVIVVEDDDDVIHFENSSDLTLSTSLDDLYFATLNIDVQSIDVDAPPNIIHVDEDDDSIDDKDPLPYDLADSDDEDLANDDDDDDVAVVYYSEKE
ncbi:hypothetical protein Tco_1014176 [Tanacetum coccineum]